MGGFVINKKKLETCVYVYTTNLRRGCVNPPLHPTKLFFINKIYNVIYISYINKKGKKKKQLKYSKA